MFLRQVTIVIVMREIKENIMTKRTFGLLSTLSVLSIALFTAALVILYPNPTLVQATKDQKSDTRAIDASRHLANTLPAQQSGTSTSSVEPRVPGHANEVASTEPTSNSTQPIAHTPASTQTTQPAAHTSSQPVPTSASNNQNQLPLIPLVNGILDHAVSPLIR